MLTVLGNRTFILIILCTDTRTPFRILYSLAQFRCVHYAPQFFASTGIESDKVLFPSTN